MKLTKLKLLRDIVSSAIVPCLIYTLYAWDVAGLQAAGSVFLVSWALSIVIHRRDKEKERKEQSNRHWIVMGEYTHLLDLEERKN